MCRVFGCTTSTRARHMCMHHYNRWRLYGDPLGGPAEVSECLQCGAPTPKPRVGPRSSYCSSRCQSRAQYLRTVTTRRPARRKEQRSVVCPCGQEFTSARLDARFCSKRCSSRWQRENAPTGCAVSGCPRPLRAKGMCNTHYRKGRGEKPQPWDDKRRDAYHRRRAQKKATAVGRPVLLSEIRERDGNRCHLCRRLVSAKPYPHPLSASLDHLVPLSLDGDHVPENVRLAHLRCNVAKGNRGGNEQLLLIG